MGPDLLSIKRITGVSRNQLSEALHVPVARVAQWEEEPSKIPQEAWDNLQGSFEGATLVLDGLEFTWDQVIPLRNAAMQLGLSPRVFAMKMARLDRPTLHFGALGDWVTVWDVAACRR